MRKAILIPLLALLAAAHACAAQTTPITLQQLRNLVLSSTHERDGRLADRLFSLQLTHRLSLDQLKALNAKLPGHKSRQALLILADQSQFLPPPPAQIPARPAPPIPRQQAIVNKAIAYVVATLHRLPNLFARTHTLRYRNAPPVMLNGSTGSTMQYGIRHKIDHSNATVLYRDGREVVQKGTHRHNRITPSSSFMSTYGEFGPVFSVIFGDLPNGKIKWARWTQTPDGMDAVFRFTVPRAASHYVVGSCCVHGRPFQEAGAYHGELTVNPSTGTIRRLTIITDAPPDAPLAHWGMLVQYAPVALGGKQYDCPVKSIAVYRGPANPTAPGIYKRQGIKNSAQPNAPILMQNQLNQTTYTDYHLFRANVKILPYKGHPPAKPSTQPTPQPQP